MYFLFLDFEMSEIGFYIYFGSSIVLLESELPRDSLAKNDCHWEVLLGTSTQK